MRASLLSLAALAVLLGGCDTARDALHPGEAEIIDRSWMKREIVSRPEALYCYRTLGREDCYRAPIPGERRRLIEHYGPPPDLPPDAPPG